MKVLETERLSLRQLNAADAPFILLLLNDPDFIRYIGDRNLRTLEDARTYLQNGPQASYSRHGFGLYLVERKDSGAPIGICGLIKRESLEDSDIGFAFLPEHRGQGFAYEAAAAVLAFGQEALNLPRVAAIVTPENERSIRLLTRLGLVYKRIFNWPEDGSILHLYTLDLPPAPVALRPVLADDVEIFFAHQQDPAAQVMAAFTAPNPADEAAFRARWDKILADETLIKRTILSRGQPAGHIVCHRWFGEPEVGYWLGREFWGQGIASRALNRFLPLVPYRPVYARAAKDNLASIRVLQNAGFTPSGEAKEYSTVRRAVVPQVIYTRIE